MCNNYNSRQICLLNQLRLLWSQHVYWTRFFILSVAEGLADLEPVTARPWKTPQGFPRPLHGSLARGGRRSLRSCCGSI